MKWLYYLLVQLIMLTMTVLGWFLLIPLCLLWSFPADARSIKDQREIDLWGFWLLDLIYGNPEDGPSGKYALIPIVNADRTAIIRVAWWPNANPIIRAYCWSAWRNSTDGLKYALAWKNGPLICKGYYLRGKYRTLRIGWQLENGFNVPVLGF